MSYSVIIADDEKWIRELVRLSIDWACLNCEIVAVFGDGQNAIEFAKEHHPDIAILDMEMPGASGREILDAMVEDFPETAVIVLSGYSDFEYVRHALRRGAADYLLKPLDEDQLEVVVRKAITVINERKRRRVLMRHVQARVSRLESERIESKKDYNQNKTGDLRIDAVLNQIDSSLSDPPTLEQAADSVGLSPSYFSALFSQVHGTSYVEALRNKRIITCQRFIGKFMDEDW